MSKGLNSISRVFAAAAIFIAVVTHFAASAAEKPFVVFLVHGLGGSPASFGKMPEILQKEFGSGRILVKALSYETTSSEKTHSQFVTEIAPQMAKFYRDHRLDPNTDRFAFVVHSQGGIVARNYLFQCIQSPTCDRQGVIVPKKPALLMTLGTPHWGSPMGNKMSDGSVLGGLLGWAGGKMYGQYKQLAIGSTLMHNDRLTMIRYANEWQAQGFKFFAPGMRFVSVGGNVAQDVDRFSAPVREALRQTLFNDINEDDVVVPSSHANPNFHYYVEREQGRGDYATTAASGDVKLTDDVHLVRLPHMDFAATAAEKLFPGIASPQATEHIGVLYVLSELAHNHLRHAAKAAKYDAEILRVNRAARGDADKVREFSSEVVIAMPLGYQRKPELPADNKVPGSVFVNQAPDSLYHEGTIETMTVGNSVAFKAYGLNRSDFEQVNKPYFVFMHSGRFAPEDAAVFGSGEKPAKVCYSMDFRGFRSKNFCTIVRPGESSFAKVILEPYQPIADAKTQGRMVRGGGLIAGYDRKTEQAVVISGDGRASQSLIDGSSLPADMIESLEQQCAVAYVGTAVGVHKGQNFRTPFSLDPIGYFASGERLEIIGRMRDAGRGLDRYLLRAKHGFSWINAVDVDVIEGEKCSRGFFN